MQVAMLLILVDCCQSNANPKLSFKLSKIIFFWSRKGRQIEKRLQLSHSLQQEIAEFYDLVIISNGSHI